ncbi:thiol:disulfide interchange protein DsbA [Enterobacteriaceae endosymbiont of Donacia clavipes]|uniref:thiol:disulfide interchange protein DsbA n=1 Tax=Enterobacteriaceae endosymbiont of Donacia clavipes TaxID=2675775 RepID=UPI001449E82F|nr:thiol:disulfide interchange protein DsbA [Enterobacteriaceae endosymbiont of Donacia clavipes]QJC33442.1 thiol:disulfide interchange protein DsbA [Enterobacteriaceae endosymbiont of Donacia clavipes]
MININIKKYMLFFNILLCLTISSVCFASELPQSFFYDVLTPKEQVLYNKEISHKKPIVVEFFSFLCPRCYEFYLGINQKSLKGKMPKNIKIFRYHLNQFDDDDGFGSLIGYAWIVAKMLNVENKVIGPIFEGIHKNNSIHDYESIKKIFVKKAGVSNRIFSSAWHSYIAKILFIKETNLAEKLDIHIVPNIYVNNKYEINLSELYSSYYDNFFKYYIDLVIKLSKN